MNIKGYLSKNQAAERLGCDPRTIDKWIEEGKLYIQTGHRKRTAQQLTQNGKAEICAYNTTTHAWVRICGTLVEDPRVEPKKAMLDDYPELRGMYNENDDNTAVYFFTDAVAWFSSFTEPEKEIRF